MLKLDNFQLPFLQEMVTARSGDSRSEGGSATIRDKSLVGVGMRMGCNASDSSNLIDSMEVSRND